MRAGARVDRACRVMESPAHPVLALVQGVGLALVTASPLLVLVTAIKIGA